MAYPELLTTDWTLSKLNGGSRAGDGDGGCEQAVRALVNKRRSLTILGIHSLRTTSMSMDDANMEGDAIGHDEEDDGRR